MLRLKPLYAGASTNEQIETIMSSIEEPTQEGFLCRYFEQIY